MFFKPKQTSEEELQKRDISFQRENSAMERAIKTDEVDYIDRENRSDLIRWQQDLDEDLINLINDFLGFAKTGDKLVKVHDPICNISFIQEIVIPNCRPFFSRNMFNTTWDNRFILETLESTSQNIINAMAEGHDRYKIDFINLNSIVGSIMTYFESSAYRCLDGFTMSKNAMMIKRVEAMNEQVQDQNKKRLWGLLN